MSENRFNLVEEPWIPITGVGLVSLRTVFSDSTLTALGGNPVQKIALTKFLLAISQCAFTPQNEEEWRRTTSEEMASKSLSYLEERKDHFWLYGEKPFLQMPGVCHSKIQSYGAVQVHVSTGNSTILTEAQIERSLSDSDKAILLIELMGFALGGKKTDHSVVLTHGLLKKSSGVYGASIGCKGFLHSFLIGKNLQETLMINLFTHEELKDFSFLSKGLGIPPWEKMPDGEDCIIAGDYKKSYLGRLIPISRFMLFSENGIHYTEGIKHLDYQDGMRDPSITACYSSKKPKVLWVDPDKKTWRQLVSMLSFLSKDNTENYDCLQLHIGIERFKKVPSSIVVWSGGLRVSSNAGEQYVSGSDDYVESEFSISTEFLGKEWFTRFKLEMNELENLSKIIFSSVKSFYKKQKADGSKQASKATGLFWQLCEKSFLDMINACSEESGLHQKEMRKKVSSFAHQSFDTFCPKETSRQLEAWAYSRPDFKKYLK